MAATLGTWVTNYPITAALTVIKTKTKEFKTKTIELEVVNKTKTEYSNILAKVICPMIQLARTDRRRLDM